MDLVNLFLHRYSDGVFHIQAQTKKSSGLDKIVYQTDKSKNELTDLKQVNNESTTKENRLTFLESQNKQLRELLDKLDSYSQEQDTRLEMLQEIQQKYDRVEEENKVLCDQLELFRNGNERTVDKLDYKSVNHELETENSKLMERIVTLEDELETVKKEKDSLISTLKLLQDELMASEQYRHRIHNDG